MLCELQRSGKLAVKITKPGLKLRRCGTFYFQNLVILTNEVNCLYRLCEYFQNNY